MLRNAVLMVLFFAVTSAECYKILGVFPYPGKSHFHVFQPLLKELAAKGHELTVISHFPQQATIPRYTDVSLANTSPNTGDMVDVNEIPNWRIVKHLTPVMLSLMADDTCSNLNHSNVQRFLEAKPSFDVILIEQFNTDCFLPLVHQLKSPFVGITSHVLMPWTNSRVGNLDNPSYIPNHFLDFSDRMSFINRVENTLAYIFSEFVAQFFIRCPDNKRGRSVFGDETPDVAEIAKNMSMVLTYTHFSLNRPRPFVPAVAEIGGLHIGHKKELPKNLERWINESGDDGVIYFSMGSMIKGHTFPEDKRRAFLRAFGRLGQRVLWKWENDTMPGKPDNVMIQKWMPQFDILCHPNVKAFISHGGLLGTTEAVHCGVPVVVMPQFGDQHTNARALEASGGGVVLNFKDLTEDSIYKALKTVLDPKFNKQAKELSERFRDRPMPPMETAIYWIEYVARHKGAHHMRTAAVGMPFYQYLLLDVIAFLSAVILTALYVIYKAVKFVAGKICGGKKKKVKKN